MTSTELLNSILDTQSPCSPETLLQWHAARDWTRLTLPCLEPVCDGLRLKGRRCIGWKDKEDFQM